jgi:hypothetical protein
LSIDLPEGRMEVLELCLKAVCDHAGCSTETLISPVPRIPDARSLDIGTSG